MEQLPLFLEVKDKKIVVTGGGTSAARKSEMALRAGANVHVFARELSDAFHELADHERLTHVPRDVNAGDFDDCVVAYGASDDPRADEHVHTLAKAARVLVNVPDKPQFCDFISPAVLDRSPLVVAISTGGASPVLARMIKASLAAQIPASFGTLAAFVSSYRDLIKEKLSAGRDRLRFWERMIEGPVADAVMAGKTDEAHERVIAELDAATTDAERRRVGEVYLVGAGPGNPDLLTFRALRLMQRADVVLYDRLIGDEIMDLVRRDAERIYVGKLPKSHTVPQDDLSEMLVRLAREGKRVLRLKGGDPFIFGRGGEEMETLAAEGIPFQIVPGVTAAAGCAAYAGIPLTHRDHAQACVFVTGHGKDGIVDMDWNVLLQPRQTVAIYMGLSNLAPLLGEFISRGASPELPAAAVDNGTRPNQKTVVGTLANLAERVAGADFEGPSMIIIGTVVTLHDRLTWFHPDATQKSTGMDPLSRAGALK